MLWLPGRLISLPGCEQATPARVRSV